MPDGAEGTEPRTPVAVARYHGGDPSPDPGEGEWFIVWDEARRSELLARRYYTIIPVRVVEQQPPTENRAFTDEDVERGATWEQWPGVTNEDLRRANWVAPEGQQARRNIVRAVLGAVALPPGPPEPPSAAGIARRNLRLSDGRSALGPPEPTHDMPAKRGFDEGVAAVVEELENAERKFGSHFTPSAYIIYHPRFKGAARDTGGRDDG